MTSLLPAYLRGHELVRVARLRTRREGVRIDGAEVVDDAVAVLDGQRVTQRFRELEVELIDGDERTLRRLEKALRRAGARSGALRPKLSVALDLVDEPFDERPAIGASPRQAVATALHAQYRRMLAHDPGTRLGTDAEDLHQLRVATRRSRAFLRAAMPLLDREWANDLRAELAWLGAALGPVRDLDVQIDHLEGELASIDGLAAPGLVEDLRAERDRARVVLAEALDDPRYLALLDRMEATADPTVSTDADDTLAGLWWREFKRTRKAFERLRDASPDEQLHAARIQVKRARYSAELARAELGEPGEAFVEAAKSLQEILGTHQDATIAEERISAWVADDPSRAEVARRAARPSARPEAGGARRLATCVGAAGAARQARETVSNPVRAAGGVIVRDGAGGRDVLLVHRPAYGDWTFPKGKVEPGETDEECALREVAGGDRARVRARRELRRPSTSTGMAVRRRCAGGRWRSSRATLAFDHEVDEAGWLSPGEPLRSPTTATECCSTICSELGGSDRRGELERRSLAQPTAGGRRETFEEPCDLGEDDDPGEKGLGAQRRQIEPLGDLAGRFGWLRTRLEAVRVELPPAILRRHERCRRWPGRDPVVAA